MKLLLGCKNIKPWLRNKHNVYGEYHCFPEKVIAAQYLNGKIVAECDFEVEEIACSKIDYDLSYAIDGTGQAFYDNSKEYKPFYLGLNISNIELLKRSCLTNKEMYDYLKGENGYAIHIKNLHIFDEPRELDDYYSNKELMLEILKVWEDFGLPDIDDYKEASFKQFPKNMCYAYDEKESYIFLPVEPEEACRILKGMQTIIIRKTILKDIKK